VPLWGRRQGAERPAAPRSERLPPDGALQNTPPLPMADGMDRPLGVYPRLVITLFLIAVPYVIWQAAELLAAIGIAGWSVAVVPRALSTLWRGDGAPSHR
jgi:hypothetical protein